MSAPGLIIAAADSPYEIDEHDILVDPQSGLPQAAWSKDATIRNRVDVRYDFNDAALKANDFGRRQVWTATSSVTRHGPQPAIQLDARGVRTDLGGQALMDALALGFLQRWGYTPPMLRVAVTFRRHLFEVLDSVRVSHPLIANPLTGAMGLVREDFEVLEVTPSWLTEGKVELLLLWTGVIETSAVPTSGGAYLLVSGVPETTTVGVAVGLGGSIQVTTPASTRSLTLGFYALAVRVWQCVFDAKAWQNPYNPDPCPPAGIVYRSTSYSGQVFYRIDYKTDSAPDAAGTGADPLTGWVPMLGVTARGAVAQFQALPPAGQQYVMTCYSEPQNPNWPPWDYWALNFPTLGASPNTYDIKVYFIAVDAVGDPCPAFPGNWCSTAGCSGTLLGGFLSTDYAAFVVDYFTAIS